MHGRMKVRSTEEQEKAKKKERETKAIHYRTLTERIYTKREAGETDDEALQLTRDVLAVNPEITTLWNYRREVLGERQKTMSSEEYYVLCDGELSLLERCLRVNPKAYCVWSHREWVMLNRPDPDWVKEKSLCDLFLKYDERNFHCWDYRRFVISRSKCVTPTQELSFTYDKIATNFSNYSAWHYRSKLLPILHPSQGGVSEDALLKEYELAQNAFFTDPDDQSAWFYHRWLLGEVVKPVRVDLIYVLLDPQPLICVVFNQPTKLDQPLVVSVGEWSATVKLLEWPSALHTSPLPSSTTHTLLQVSYGQQTVSINVPGGWWMNAKGLSPHTSTVATCAVLNSELDSCRELLEEEPRNKWCLLTTMLLMATLDPHKHLPEIRDKAHQLMVIDPYRRLYYSDLLSQFVLKEFLRECLLDHSQRTIDLSGKGLSRLSLPEYLVPYHTVLLSNNCLHSLPPLVLPGLQTLVLDGNSLSTLPPLQTEALQVLSLRDNNLLSLSAIEATLKQLPALEVLSLQGNPLTKEVGLVKQLKEIIPSLKELNGECV